MTMDRDRFVESRRDRWDELRQLNARRRLSGRDWARLAKLYRQVCADLSTARSLGLSDDIQHFLDELSGTTHNLLYSGRSSIRGFEWIRSVASGFPRAVRANGAFFWLATALFYGPFFVGGIGAWLNPDFAALVLSPSGLEMYEAMYQDVTQRETGADLTMVGFYIMNNVGIAFRCFATGVLAGTGSMYFLVFNGLNIGTAFGHLAREGLGANLLDFVSGHSAWELTGICTSGAAGLRMGWALVVTEGRTRVASLRAAGPDLFHLVLGTAFLLFVAALIEGLWSAGPVPFAGKVVFGLVQWGLVGSWLAFGGRRSR